MQSPPNNNLYVIYYGWLISGADSNPNDAARTIAAAKPQALIASFYTFEPKHPNLSPQVCTLLHAAGVQIFAYVDTNYGTRPIDAVQAEALDYVNHDVDGIFFDQVYNFLDETRLAYYQSLTSLVKNYSKMIIMNTGVAECGETLMGLTDILMVEHDWRNLYRTVPWHARYTAARFMGNSSNEWPPDECLGYVVDCNRAVHDTREAWANAIGWHYSTDRYITLPSWFTTYVNSMHPNA